MKKLRSGKIILTSLFISLLSFSCEVGLGEAIDITAPEIKIISPTVSQSVSKQFVITGVASDDFGLKEVTVDIAGDGLNEKFQWKGSSWQRLNNDLWEDYDSVTNNGNAKKLEFSIPIDASNAVSGHEYTITTKVSDLYSNEGGKTKDERNVIIDTTEPVVSIIEPVRLFSATDSQFDTYVLKNNSILPKIKNGTFTISGSQKEDTNLDYLVVYLDKETSTIPLLPRTSTYPVQNPLVKKEITGENLRNWSTTITAEDFTDQSILDFDRNADNDVKNKGHILRLVTESHDQAGNVEIKSHGWFKFNNGADIPWVSATFGENTLEESKVVSKRVYPRCSLQGQAYDDDGLKEISIKIYEEDGTTEIADYSIKEDKLKAEGYPTYKAWSFNALSETKSIVVKVNCTDKNGIVGEEVVRYLTISDVNPPNISNLNPANGSAVIGDKNGYFEFSGTVDDDGSIEFVKIVRIKSGNDADQMLYFDKDYEGWKKCTSTAAPYTDPHGNKVWMLPLRTESTNGENRKVRTWTKKFNIFTDFGIDGTEKLTNQRFIILAQDIGNSGNIEAYTLQGDIEPPVLTIDKIYLNNDSTNYTLKDEPIELPKPFTRDDKLQITDKIKLSGTWKDNSTDIWSDKSKHGKLDIKIADRPLIPEAEYNTKSEVEKAGFINATITVKNDGTWETNYFTPIDSSVSVISASINDWAGNIVSKSRSYYVNSSTPILSRIGAETADGSYNEGKEILITMEFNKAVKLEGGTPTLILNVTDENGVNRKAIYVESSNGTSKHIFKYKVYSNENVEKLNVIGIEKDGIKWHDDAPAYIENLTVPVTGGLSLGGGRSIVIDTKPPALNSLTAISGAGWNNAGKSIFIQATFSEDIAITPEDLKDLKLKFNNGAVTDTATKTGPRTVLFKYVVKSTDKDTDKLQIVSVQSSGYNITDIAGNKLTTITTLPNNLPVSGSDVIKIDVNKPSVPTIKDLPQVTGSNTVYADEFTFTIDFNEAGAVEKKYTLDGSTWLDYKGEVTVSQNGTYNIGAYQVDAAGNKSDTSVLVTRKLNKNKFISYITAEEADGIYTTGDKIIIKLICNEPFTVDTTKTGGVSNAYLTLNTSPEQKAYYLSGSGTTELKFEYTIQEGDRCDVANGLTVKDFFSSVKTDTNAGHIDWNTDVTSRCELPDNNNLANNRTIKVITGAPVITGITVDQTGTNPVMKIKFSNPVSKKAGKYIKISQTYSKTASGSEIVLYNAPAVLTKAQYNNFKAVSNMVDTYYEKGVNGLKADDVTPDLSEKYVLKFNYDGTTNAVRQFFRDTVIDAANNGTMLDVNIPIASSKVVINSSDKTEMLVTLSDAYKLPVKGAEYTITVPADIAVDNQGHVNPSASGKDYSYQQIFTLNGCEKPSIRVDKSECTINNKTAKQPLKAQVKIDCQTPGKTIKYSISTVETETKNIDSTSLPRDKTTAVEPNAAKAPVITSGEYSSSTPLYIGNDNNKSSGYKITIDANPDGTDVHAKEIAYRSVVRLKAGAPSASGDANGYKEADNMNKVYIRGGDSESGNSTTLGFPLSWNSGDYGKTKMMTQDGDYWYYVSWNVSVNLYYGFLRGNTGLNDADTMANGPLNWCWASCSWVGRKHLYYLRQGTSFTMVPADVYGTGGYGYQLKHAEYRPQATQKDGYGVLVNSIN